MPKYSYQEIKNKLVSHSFHLLSEENDYNKGLLSNLELKCINDHIFKTRIDNVIFRLDRESKGCPKCAEIIYLNQSLRVANANLLPKHKIIDSYLKQSQGDDKRNVRLYKVECEFGHEYEKRSGKLKNGCPKCSLNTYVGQERVKMIFEKEFNCLFPTIRPDWLVYPLTNKSLELDGYCEKLNIAFEYQGRQHASNETQFGGDYFNQKERDDYKVKSCAEHGIKLYIINQPRSYDKKIFFESVAKDCIEQELKINTKHSDIDFTKINDGNTIVKNYNNFKEFASSSGYDLISPSLSTMEDILSFKCSNNHFFEMKGSMFKTILNTKKYRDIPCLECHEEINPDKKKNIITIETCKEFATNNELECLSMEYTNVNQLMDWKCKSGHVFKKTYRQFLRSKTKNYCPECN